MTSGEFRSVSIDSIIIPRDIRHRRELTGIEELAADISEIGLMHPLIIDRDYVLLSGERRLAAVKLLGWDSVLIQYSDETEFHRKRLTELSENLKRVNISWQEECAAINEYNDIRIVGNPEWTLEMTAKALSLSLARVTDCVRVMKRAKDDPVILQANDMSAARTRIARASDREAAQQLERSYNIFPDTRVESEEVALKSILNTNFIEWSKTYRGPKFNFIHCDFPYGINTDKRQQGEAPLVHGAYEDTPEGYWELLAVFGKHLDNFCAESAHIMFWFSMHYYHETLTFLSEHFKMDPFPLIWLKSDNKGLLPDPLRGPRRIYETALFGARGDRKVVSPISNAFASPTDSSEHMSIKPEPVLYNFFRMFVDRTSTVLDPTCGSGSALRAAEALDASRVLGIEINREFAERAERALEQSRRMRNAVQDSDSR